MKILKQNKLQYYFRGYILQRLPAQNAEEKISILKKGLTARQIYDVENRVDYYCRQPFSNKVSLGTKVSDLRKPITPKAYFFDTYEYARFFDPNLPIDFLFGDIITVPATPSIVKSRPIGNYNQNSVLLNLDKSRHFVFINDDKPFLDKKNILIGRGAVYQQHRCDFYEKYYGNPLCDLGQVNAVGGNPKWKTPKMPISAHLNYKFILSLQGNDVATNLKWIMSSNSVAVMPKPTLETWFMEGKLIGGEHFIEIKSDYSNLEEQLDFYISRPEVCLNIIENAQKHCMQFLDKNVEDLCSISVLQKYFDCSQQAFEAHAHQS